MPDAFDLLSLPPTFDLTPAQVRTAYLAMAATPPAPGDDPQVIAARLNAAKAALQDAESRANLLLARLDGPGPAESRQLPVGFLERVLQAREELEAAAAEHRADLIHAQRAWAEAQRSGLIASVGGGLAAAQKQAEAGVHDKAALAAVRRDLNAWRYIERMLEQIDSLV